MRFSDFLTLVHRFFWCCLRCGFYLQEGNIVAVRACAHFSGWELHAHSTRLVVRISNNGMHAFYLTACSSCLSIRPFQDLDEPLRSLLSIGKQSSNLIKTCKRCCKYTSTLSHLRAMQQPFRLKRRFSCKSCADRWCWRTAFVFVFFFFFLVRLCLFVWLMKVFQMEALMYTEYPLYMFWKKDWTQSKIGTSKRPEVVSVLHFFYLLANGDRTESSISLCATHCKPCLHQNDPLSGMCI